MKNFFIRVLTGVVYISVILVALFTTPAIFFTIMGVLMLLILNEFYKNLRVKNITVDLVMANVLALSIYSLPIIQYYTVGYTALPFVVLFLLCLFAVELFQQNENPFHRISFALCGIVYIVVPFTLLALYKADCLMNVGLDFSTYMLLALFLFTWANDSFAYVWGMLLGKHPFCQRISPKKTVEGFVGGVISTVVIAVLMVRYASFPQYTIALAVVVTIFSTLGDLVESSFKRYLGVKDTGTILPGHGGFLDRFDSILFSVPAFYAFEMLMQ